MEKNLASTDISAKWQTFSLGNRLKTKQIKDSFDYLSYVLGIYNFATAASEVLRAYFWFFISDHQGFSS
jgi:hypothetical protein